MSEKDFKIPKDGIVKGPICAIFAEDTVGLTSTIRHHHRLGFKNILVLKRPELNIPESCQNICIPVDIENAFFSDISPYLNQLIKAFDGEWLYHCFNAEYLHFPFCETRYIKDFTDFITEEKRSAVFTYVLDLYPEDLGKAPDGFSLEDAYFDGAGYYGLQRYMGGQPLERQLDIFGGLKWRFEEHTPYERRHLNRISLLKARPNITMDENGHLSDPELNTYSCPWHHSTTATICSFRTAKSLKTNPGSMFEINDFMWSKSVKFRWNSQQLLDYGFLETGQWF